MMTHANRFAWLLAAIAATTLFLGGACVLLPLNAPQDLTFVSARMVPIEDLPDDDKAQIKSSGSPPRTTIEVSFISNDSDLMRSGVERVTTDWCDNWPNRNALHNDYTHIEMGGVYWHDINIMRSLAGKNGPVYAELPASWKTEQPHVYHIYLWSNLGTYYDFREEVKDVCFQMFKVGTISLVDTEGSTNALLIPKTAIVAAMTASP